jgi:hypothetical protein
MYPVAQPAASERVRAAYQSRHQTDYEFNFWTALGWTLLSCGIFGFYVLYQLVRRSRDHNRRRIELLDAAVAFGWEKAQAAGVDEELRPNFERAAGHLDALRALDAEFRDPALWLVLSIFVSILVYVVYGLLDSDLVRHDFHEGGVESELAVIYGRLGQPLPPPDPAALKQKHNYVGRAIATVFTCGLYSLWWQYDVLTEGNAHYRTNWASEDALAGAVQALL